MVVAWVGAGWTIATPNEEFVITPEKACIAGECKPTGKIEIDERGFWWVKSIDVDLRWADAHTVQIRKPRQPWVAGQLKYEAPAKLPLSSVVEELGRWDRGVLPGVWTLGTEACKADTTAWAFQPLVSKAPVQVVVGKKVSKGKVEACKDGAPGMYVQK